MKEEEFWRNYFYRLSLIKQSFDLKDLENSEEGSKGKAKNDSKKVKKQSESEMNLEEELA